ncbi:hypothetical protein PALU110988_18845 [Paenibacillus lupini]|nr:hypothetical protein [Paenibacillus lupini]
MNFKVETGRVQMLGAGIAFDRIHYHNFERRSFGVVFICFAVWFSWDKDTSKGGAAV